LPAPKECPLTYQASPFKDKGGIPGASPQGAANSACAGTIDALSALVDYRPYQRLDVYAGVVYSWVTGGITSGYIHSANIAPTAGMRLSF